MRSGQEFVKSASESINEKHEVLMVKLNDALGSKILANLNKKLEVFVDIFSKNERRIRDSQAQILIYSAAPKYFLEMILLTVVGLFSAFIINTQTSIAGSAPYFGLLALCAVRLLLLVQTIFAGFSMLMSTQAAAKQLRDIVIPKNKNNKAVVSLSNENDDCKNLDGDIEIFGMSKSFGDNLIFQNMNLSIKAGERICIIGESGSGKSTLLKILLALENPDHGVLKYAEIKITQANRKFYHNLVSYTGQSVFMLNGTVRSNLRFFLDDDVSDRTLVETIIGLKLANSETDAKKFLEKNVGENGCHLSGGQRQRLGIARSLITQEG